MFPIILAGLLSRTAGVAGGMLLGWVLGRMTAGGSVLPFRGRSDARSGGGRDGTGNGHPAPGMPAPDQEHGLPLRLRQHFNDRPAEGLVPAE